MNRLKEKYQPQRANLDISQQLPQDHQIVLENFREFKEEKDQDYEANLPE